MILRKPSVLLNILLPLILGILLLYYYANRIGKAADIGLGVGTSSYTPFIGKYPIHVMSLANSDSMIAGWKQRGSIKPFVWLGNSQLHGVNQYANGKANCVEFIGRKLKVDNKEILGVSYPNANLQEFLVSVLHLSHQLPVQAFIMPVFFDDMREDGIRDEISLPNVISTIKTDSLYYDSVESIKMLENKPGKMDAEGKTDFSGIKETLQDISERILNNKFDSLWSIWRARANIRGNLFNDIYKTRNMLLSITATSVRKMIPGRYEQNYSALKQILRYCKDEGIKLYIYIPPIRNDVSLPYDLTEYAAFKTNLEKDINSFGHHFINLENLVPAKYWGMKESTNSFGGGEIDFMHFQEAGHKLLADTMFQVINKSR